jgi:hypothetical protein
LEFVCLLLFAFGEMKDFWKKNGFFVFVIHFDKVAKAKSKLIVFTSFIIYYIDSSILLPRLLFFFKTRRRRLGVVGGETVRRPTRDLPVTYVLAQRLTPSKSIKLERGIRDNGLIPCKSAHAHNIEAPTSRK